MNLRRLIGLEVAPEYAPNGDLIVTTCPNGHPLTEEQVISGEVNLCPVCRDANLPPDRAKVVELLEDDGGEGGPEDVNVSDTTDEDDEPSGPRLLALATRRAPWRPAKRRTWTDSDPAGAPMGKKRTARLHHTVAEPRGGPKASREVERAFWRMIRRLHRDQGKGDIAYTIGACLTGRAYVLRGFRYGAHTCNHNGDSYAIVMAGNFDRRKTNRAIRRAVRRSLRWMIDKGKLARDFRWMPHSATGACSGPTACPGRFGRASMDSMVPAISR